jgi:hypothetical protein
MADESPSDSPSQPSGLALLMILLGLAASVIALVAGFWLFTDSGDQADEAFVLGQTLGLYFIAKGLFMGPALIAAGLTYDRIGRLAR